MELQLDITINDNCSIDFWDLRAGYLPSCILEKPQKEFKYSETASIALIQYNKSTGPELGEILYIPHEYGNLPTNILVNLDGWITFMYLVLPTKEWLEYTKENYMETFGYFETIYFTDDSKIYLWEMVPVYLGFKEVITEIYLEDFINLDLSETTAYKICDSYFSLCHLNRCYLNIVQEILRSAAFNPCNKRNQTDPDLIYRRDLVWMSLNIMQYLVEKNQLAEALRILERISGCNGLCKDENPCYTGVKSKGCNCGG